MATAKKKAPAKKAAPTKKAAPANRSKMKEPPKPPDRNLRSTPGPVPGPGSSVRDPRVMNTAQVDARLSQAQKDARGSRLDVYTPRSSSRGQGGISGVRGRGAGGSPGNGSAGGGRGRFGGGGLLGRGK